VIDCVRVCSAPTLNNFEARCFHIRFVTWTWLRYVPVYAVAK